jgi:cytochrome c peroxidase
MRKIPLIFSGIVAVIVLLVACSKADNGPASQTIYAAVATAFGAQIDLNNLANYAAQPKPAYIVKDNTGNNPITNAKATLGRVLFYDKKLSIDNTISCASCHKQAFAFSDTALISSGVAGGLTDRHSMRLVNERFGVEAKFFWDERAANLENQTTQPIADHKEMGFSGQAGRAGIAALLAKLQATDYYNELFKFTYGDITVTEPRLQESLGQFIRSIQSFDAKYDVGRAQVNNDRQPFPNFTAQENTGKDLFLTPPVFDGNSSRIGGGLGCNGCHNAPEFDIDPNTRNNGVIALAVGAGQDVNVTRAPTLRDLVNNRGELNTRLMHTGGIRDLATAVSHYGGFINDNRNLDQRLKPNGVNVQRLNLQPAEIAAVVAFLKTLAGTNVYTDKKWATPFN